MADPQELSPLEAYFQQIQDLNRRLQKTPLETYEPLPHQARFHSCLKRERALIAGNRVGKSEAGVVETARYALGLNPHRKVQAPNFGWVISVSNEAQREILQPKFEKWLRPYFAREPLFRHKQIWDRLELKNGSIIGFKSLEMDRKVFQGAQIRYAWFDEEPDEDVFGEVRARLLDQSGDLWVTLTPLLGIDWSYDWFVNEETRTSETAYFGASMWDNAVSHGGHIKDEEIQRFEDSLKDPVEKAIRVYGQYKNRTGLVFPEFDLKIHAIDQLPKHFVTDDGRMAVQYDYYCAIDTGRNFGALFAVVDYLGNMFVFEEYFETDKSINDNARRVNNLCTTHGQWPEFTVDQKSQHKLDLADHNIHAMDSIADELTGINAVKEYLAWNSTKQVGWKWSNPRLYILRPKCKELIKQLQKYQWEPASLTGNAPGEPKNKPRKKDDHLVDCLRYLCVKRPDPPKPPMGEEDRRPMHDQIRDHAKAKLQERRAGGNDKNVWADPFGLDD